MINKLAFVNNDKLHLSLGVPLAPPSKRLPAGEVVGRWRRPPSVPAAGRSSGTLAHPDLVEASRKRESA